MPTLIDDRFNALRDLGYTGSINDMLLQWLQAGGATSPAIPDAWREFFIAQGVWFDNPHPNDAWYAYLVSQGYGPGHISDMESAFWGGSVPIVAGINQTNRVFASNSPIYDGDGVRGASDLLTKDIYGLYGPVGASITNYDIASDWSVVTAGNGDAPAFDANRWEVVCNIPSGGDGTSRASRGNVTFVENRRYAIVVDVVSVVGTVTQRWFRSNISTNDVTYIGNHIFDGSRPPVAGNTYAIIFDVLPGKTNNGLIRLGLGVDAVLEVGPVSVKYSTPRCYDLGLTSANNLTIPFYAIDAAIYPNESASTWNQTTGIVTAVDGAAQVVADKSVIVLAGDSLTSGNMSFLDSTTTGVAAFKLIDSGGAFNTVYNADFVTGCLCTNNGTGAQTRCMAVDSDTQLSVADDIFTSGASYRLSYNQFEYPAALAEIRGNTIVIVNAVGGRTGEDQALVTKDLFKLASYQLGGVQPTMWFIHSTNNGGVSADAQAATTQSMINDALAAGATPSQIFISNRSPNFATSTTETQRLLYNSTTLPALAASNGIPAGNVIDVSTIVESAPGSNEIASQYQTSVGNVHYNTEGHYQVALAISAAMDGV